MNARAAGRRTVRIPIGTFQIFRLPSTSAAESLKSQCRDNFYHIVKITKSYYYMLRGCHEHEVASTVKTSKRGWRGDGQQVTAWKLLERTAKTSKIPKTIEALEVAVPRQVEALFNTISIEAVKGLPKFQRRQARVLYRTRVEGSDREEPADIDVWDVQAR